MNRGPHLIATLAALIVVAPAVQADAGINFGAYSTGSFIPSDPTLPVNTGFGTITQLADGSQISHMGCIAATAGGVGCTTTGLPIIVDTWYKRPNLPTQAAAQAFADYGELKARAWRTESPHGNATPGDPLGSRSFFSSAESEWREVLIYNGTTPTPVTMEFTLHATWHDLGRFAFTLGAEYVGDENVRGIDGLSYVNCGGTECLDTTFIDTPIVQVLGNDPANSAGDVTLQISYTFLLSRPFTDPGAPPGPHLTFVANLQTFAAAAGAEVDAFQTVTLNRIVIQPDAQISFESGHLWPVSVVPEPATYGLWLIGLAGAVVAKRRHLRSR
jgi:hypothetical protein